MKTINIPERTEGRIEEIGGVALKNLGALVGSERLELKGKGHELHGQATQETAKAIQRAEGAAEELAGGVQRRLGQLVDDEPTKIKGRLLAMKGEARQKANPPSKKS